jgi:DNA replication protein DnaC
MLINQTNTLKAQYEFATTYPDQYRHPAIVGGFGSGKTASIALRWVYLINWRAANQCVQTKMMIVEPTKEMIRDILIEQLDKFFNRYNIPHHYHKTEHNYTIRLKKAGKFYNFMARLRSSDVPEALTGKNLTDVIIDEYDKKHSVQHQKDVWKECISRTREAALGTVGVVTTPEGYKNTYELWGECDYKEKKNFKLIRAKTYDNFFNPPDYVENLREQYSAELVKQYIEAEFINLLQGKVYYAFNRSLNNTERVYDPNTPIDLCVDFNVNPMKWVVTQRFGENLFAIDEIVKQNTYTEEMAKEFRKRYMTDHAGGLALRKVVVYGDYSGNSRDTRTRTTDYEIIKSIIPNCELRVKPNGLVIDRINAVNSRFCNSQGARRFFINVNKCPHLTRDFEQVVWKEKTREIDKTTNPDLTHASDAVGYRIVYDWPLKGSIITKVSNMY